MGNEQGKQGLPTPAGIHSMDESLQKKFSKGIQYNMKIVIRGDRNTGKTTLFHRMEGKAFSEAYAPTNEIQVTSILWSYQVTNDTVKVEIWDVVDKGRSQRRSSGGKGLLKMFNTDENDVDDDESGQTLDANFLDVYKGAHGVVFCFDITKQWTWKYIERKLSEVPLHIPVIILANYCDMNEHRLISRDNCLAVIETLRRPDGAADVRYAECSMKNGFGLMHLHKFLSIPFLQLQQETLLQQLKTNREQSLAAMEELDGAVQTDDQNYTMYLAKLQRIADEKRQRMAARQDSVKNDGGVCRDASEGNSTPPRSHQPAVEQPPPPSEGSSQPPRSSSFAAKLSSRFSGFLGKGKEDAKSEETKSDDVPSKPKVVSAANIEEFVPDGPVDDFLDDDDDDNQEEDEDDENSDSDAGNPMIAGDEDLSSPEITPIPSSKKISRNVTLDNSDSDSDEEDLSLMTPIKAHPPQSKPRSTKPLKSAMDVELTESEEEEEAPVIKGIDDIDGIKKRSTIPLKTGRRVEGFDIFEPLPPTVDKIKKKNTGLMLQFDTSSSSSPSKKQPVLLDTQESPDHRRKEKKKKKSKKKKPSKEEDAVGDLQDGKGTTVSADPFEAIASLDAWLNSDSNNVVLTPTKVNEIEVEEGNEEVDGDDTSRPKKTKKHKHKSRGDGGEDERRSSHKKKHKSHHHKHKELDQGNGDYQKI